MSSRIKTAPSLLVAAFLASVVSTATPCVAAGVANDCLNGPKHQAPPVVTGTTALTVPITASAGLWERKAKGSARL